MGLSGEATTHTFNAVELKTSTNPYSSGGDGTNLNTQITQYLYDTADIPNDIELISGMNCTINNTPHRIAGIEFIPGKAMGKLFIHKLV